MRLKLRKPNEKRKLEPFTILLGLCIAVGMTWGLLMFLGLDPSAQLTNILAGKSLQQANPAALYLSALIAGIIGANVLRKIL